MIANKRETFESLHKQHYGMVFQLCMGFVKGDRDLSKDLAQEIFINIWNALSNFNGASSYKTWIYRIASNTCLKYIRDRKEKGHVAIDDKVNEIRQEHGEQTDERHQALYRAIGELPEVDRLIIAMVLDEIEYSEIAAVIGISEANLRVKIHRIKKSLFKTITK